MIPMNQAQRWKMFYEDAVKCPRCAAEQGYCATHDAAHKLLITLDTLTPEELRLVDEEVEKRKEVS